MPIDPRAPSLAGPGEPFEIREQVVHGRPMRVFARAVGNLSHLFATMPARGDTDFIVDGERRLSYAQFHALAGAVAAGLAEDCGVKPGDLVAIAMHNSPEWMVAFTALSALGAVPALINSRGSGAEMRYCTEDVGASFAITDEPRAEKLAEAGYTGTCFVFDRAALEHFAQRYAGHALPQSRADTDDPACILFTSGTTGRPKGAIITHRAMLTGIMMAQHAGARFAARMAAQLGIDPEAMMAGRPQGAVLLIFPLFHVSGCQSIFLGMMARGGKIVFHKRWNPAEALRLIEEETVTEFTGPPMTLWDVLNEPSRATRDLSSIGSIASGGQAMPTNLLAALQEAFPGRVFGGGYGMTETAGSVSLAMGDLYTARPECSGVAHDVAEMRVVDDDGAALPPGEVGEICVRGPMVMTGYWGKPEETAQAIDAEGWLKTGDVGLIDETGYVTIVDRKTNMVISKGENIYCAEIERVISDHPDVADVAAFGMPDERLGERLAVSIMPEPGRALSADDVREHVRHHLAEYKVPADVYFRDTPMPRNATGKVDRQVLRHETGLA
ncbi:MAG: class I adenylate-forming enzyme family protein [Novosphingobium sp.]|nr:class I adenylate-forming enzyme family protein [Novosphingobium sp.]